MDVNAWKLLILDGMAGHDRKWLEMAWNGWKCRDMAGMGASGGKCLKMALTAND